MSRTLNRRYQLVVDASVDMSEGGVAGLGIGYLGGHGFVAEAAQIGDGGILAAEGLAVTRGLSELADMDYALPGSIVITDNRMVYRAITGMDADLTVLGGPEIVDHARSLMAEFGFELEWRHRKFVGPAHRMARMALEIYRAGLNMEPTWSSPPRIKELTTAVLERGVPAYPPPRDPPPIAA